MAISTGAELEAKHLPALDGVRGIAIALVLLTHLGAILRDTWLGRRLEFGWIGVDLFFVLSGFLITRILIGRRTAPNYYRRFYIRRGLRIWPLYFVYVAGTLLLMRVLAHFPAAFSVTTISPAWLFLLFLQNLNAASLFCFRDSLFNITWSLCIEEHFYLLWPVCVRNLSRRRLLGLLIAVFALSPLMRLSAAFFLRNAPFSTWYQTTMRFTPLHLDSICAGCFLSLIWAGRGEVRGLARWGFSLFAGGLAGTLSCFYFAASRAVFSFCFTAIALMFAGFVGLALCGHFQAVLLNRPLRYLGRISYGLYLIHPAVFLLLQSHRVLIHFGLTRHPAAVEYLAAAVALAASVALAALSWEFFEKRVLALKARFTDVGFPQDSVLAKSASGPSA